MLPVASSRKSRRTSVPKSFQYKPLRLPTRDELDVVESEMLINEYKDRFSDTNPVLLSSEDVDALLRARLQQSLS